MAVNPRKNYIQLVLSGIIVLFFFIPKNSYSQSQLASGMPDSVREGHNSSPDYVDCHPPINNQWICYTKKISAAIVESYKSLINVGKSAENNAENHSNETVQEEVSAQDRPELNVVRNGKLVIRTGFEKGIAIEGRTLAGRDGTLLGAFNDWSNLNADMRFSLYIPRIGNGPAGRSDYGFSRDPLNPQNRVFRAEILGHNERNGRAQASFLTDRIVNPSEYYDEFYATYRMYIHPDWQTLAQMDPPRWTNFFEVWTPRLSSEQCDVCNNAGSFRINFRFNEIDGQPNQFGWNARSSDMSYRHDDDRSGWSLDNNVAPVPFGQWVTFQVYLKKGPDPKIHPDSEARFIVRMKPGSGPWYTLFDIQDQRTQHSRLPQPGYRAVSLIKNYIDADNVMFMQQRDARMVFYYDDIELYVMPTEY